MVDNPENLRFFSFSYLFLSFSDAENPLFQRLRMPTLATVLNGSAKVRQRSMATLALLYSLAESNKGEKERPMNEKLIKLVGHSYEPNLQARFHI